MVIHILSQGICTLAQSSTEELKYSNVFSLIEDVTATGNRRCEALSCNRFVLRPAWA